MDWVTGIGVENRRLVATTVDRQGNLATRELQELATVGIPTSPGMQTKKDVVTDFRDWQLVPATDYLTVHDIQSCAKTESHHHVFEFQVRRTKFQVPALVLMRAMFYPSKRLLAIMFRPQGLDNLGYVDGDHLHLLEGLVRARGTGGYRWDNQAVRSRLRWMYVYPSAYRMAHSVHEHAMRGDIGIVLPTATIRMVLTGKKVKNTYYVTDIAVKKIVPQEHAFDYLHTASSKAISDSDCSGTLPNIALRGVNFRPLSDEEWDTIQPILVPRSMHRCTLRQRDLLDAVLFKLHTGTPWRKVVCKSGTHENAAQSYRTWKERGTFGPAIEQLRLMRCSA
jgi:hypothetical protein